MYTASHFLLHIVHTCKYEAVYGEPLACQGWMTVDFVREKGWQTDRAAVVNAEQVGDVE